MLRNAASKAKGKEPTATGDQGLGGATNFAMISCSSTLSHRVPLRPSATEQAAQCEHCPAINFCAARHSPLPRGTL